MSGAPWIRKLWLGATLLLIVGCVGPTPYQPAAGARNGFSETQLAGNRYRVAFAGNSKTKRETVEIYLLYRAAEIAIDRGFTHFLARNRETEVSTYYWVPDIGYPYYGYRQLGYGYGYGNRSFAPAFAQPVDSYTAIAEVVLLTAGEAKGRIEAFEAVDVLARLGPNLTRPQPAG